MERIASESCCTIHAISLVDLRFVVLIPKVRMEPRCFASDGAPISAPPGHRYQGCWLGQLHAGDLDDGLPRGFLGGAIVEVWLTLYLDWA